MHDLPRYTSISHGYVCVRVLAVCFTGRLAGHQNTKQKIHYVMELKKENVELRLKVTELTSKCVCLGCVSRR
jgi:hypothetical protein